MSVCSSCGSYTNDYTWLRQRIICRTCWEIKCHDEVIDFSEVRKKNVESSPPGRGEEE